MAFSHEMSPQWRNTMRHGCFGGVHIPSHSGGLPRIENKDHCERGWNTSDARVFDMEKKGVFVQETLGSIHNVTRSCGGD